MADQDSRVKLPPSPGFPQLIKLAERLGVEPLGEDAPPAFITFHAGPNSRPPSYDALEILHAFLDRVDSAEAKR